MITGFGCNPIRTICLTTWAIPDDILHSIGMRPERNLHFLVALKAFEVLGCDGKVPIDIRIRDGQICRNRATSCTARWGLGTSTIESSGPRYWFRSWLRRWDRLSCWNRLCFYLWLFHFRNFWASDWKLCYWSWCRILMSPYFLLFLDNWCWTSWCRYRFTFSDRRFFHSHFIGMSNLNRRS